MSRSLLVRFALGALAFVGLCVVLLVVLVTLRPDPKPSGRVPIEFRILADPRHDARALGQIDTQGEDTLPKPPKGYRWVKVGPKSEIRPAPNNIVRRKPETGESYILVVIDPQNVNEKHIARLSPTFDERGAAAIAFSFNRDGARRFGALTRAHLPEEEGAFKYQMAIIIGDSVVSAPSINTEIRDSGIIEGGGQGFTEQEVRDLIRLLTQLIVIDPEPAR